jgi:16S rRNA (guanine966-N2)-methyltransferase
MRITTGIYKGRVLSVPPGDKIRPTSDKMRQAVFNILQQYGLPAGAVALDAFCGSGALGLEALSRGAAHAVFMDTDIKCASENIMKLGAGDAATIVRRDATKPGTAKRAADLLFLDPPYRKGLLDPALTALASDGWLAPGAICVAETETSHTPGEHAGFERLDHRTYGAASLWLFRFAG